MKTKKSTQIFVGLILSIVGISVLGLGVILISQHIEKQKTYIKTVGIVIGFEAKGGYDEDLYDNYFYDDVDYAPIVEYIVDGRIYETTHTVSSNPPQYYVGQKVSLRYNPKDPEDVIFEFNNGFWIIFIVGTVFTCCGLPITFAALKKNKSNKKNS